MENKNLDENKEVVTPEVIEKESETENENIETTANNETLDEQFVQDPEDRRHVPIVPLIIMGVIIILMIVCVIVILTTGGPYNGPSSSGSSM